MINKNLKIVLCALLCALLLLSFAACGQDNETKIVGFSLTVQEDTLCRQYGTVEVSQEQAIDGQTLLLEKAEFDLVEEMDLSNDRVALPGDYHRQVTQILAKYEFITKYEKSAQSHDAGYYGMAEAPEGEADSETRSVAIKITYSDGKTILVETKKESQINAMEGLVNDLILYHDSLCN